MAYKNCFSSVDDGVSKYRPLFWYKTDDEKQYDEIFDVIHSDCYSKYGFIRTGCAGCPFNKSLFDDLGKATEHEPQFVKAANYIFKDSYEYTKKYHEFVKEMKAKEKGD